MKHSYKPVYTVAVSITVKRKTTLDSVLFRSAHNNAAVARLVKCMDSLVIEHGIKPDTEKHTMPKFIKQPDFSVTEGKIAEAVLTYPDKDGNKVTHRLALTVTPIYL